MPFTPEQDAFILMAHFRSGTRNQDGSWSYSVQSCIEQFTDAFPEVVIDYNSFTHHKRILVHRYEEKHCICKGKTTGRHTVLTEETVADIHNRMQLSPHKSVSKLAQQTGVSVGSCHKALRKNLHMHPYKVTVLQELFVHDWRSRVEYCQWFNENLNDDNVLNLTFMSDEAWFHLSGYVNSQNYRTWGTNNPHQYIETSLHPIKIGVWVAMSRRRIIGPFFFNNTINAERYRHNILQPFIEQLHDDELREGYFQQDGATAHTAGDTIRFLQQYFDNRLISRGRWPARSPDLTPLDFFLFGYLKNKIYKNRLHTVEELQEAIEQEIRNITEEQLQRVFENMKRRINLCLEKNGEHFEQSM